MSEDDPAGEEARVGLSRAGIVVTAGVLAILAGAGGCGDTASPSITDTVTASSSPSDETAPARPERSKQVRTPDHTPGRTPPPCLSGGGDPVSVPCPSVKRSRVPEPTITVPLPSTSPPVNSPSPSVREPEPAPEVTMSDPAPRVITSEPAPEVTVSEPVAQATTSP
ncbi:hypothetical protein AB0C28_05320 [Nonomuraea sp. NPDC048892]|uniref:hypothetical protein n=1 Tax=Nonomuraea sp. NPDC048892 TaxID=3154624 RepID=UPI0033DAAD68